MPSRTHAAKPAKPKKERTVFVPDVPVATQGFWGWLWQKLLPLYARTGWKWLIVSPSQQEWRDGLTRDVASTQLKATTSNKKGGVGKTDVANAVGVHIAWATQQDVLLIDANQAKGNTASRTGINITMSIREALAALSELGVITRKWAVKNFTRHPAAGCGSLRVMTSDQEHEDNPSLKFKQVTHLFLEVNEAFENMIVDCGNNISSPTTLAAMHWADVPMFVCREGQANSMNDCLDTMAYYRRTAPTKVENGVVVVLAHTRGDSPVKAYADLFGVPIDRIILIPKDPFYRAVKVKNVKEADALIKIITPAKLQRSTRKAYLRLARLLFAIQAQADERKLAGDTNELRSKAVPEAIERELKLFPQVSEDLRGSVYEH
jgi:MinD-like ATPase involved in chromosome partitioning or flagellar assembly